MLPAEPLGCYGEGGAIFVNADGLSEKICSIHVHGKGSLKYENIRIGLSGRLNTIEAAVMLAKMTIFEDKIISIERELDIGAVDGSKIIRLINALRELSKEDEKVANVLRQFHLL